MNRLTANETKVMAWIEQAEDIGSLVLMTSTKTVWAGDLWVNHLTAKSLSRKGLIRIEWAIYEGDDIEIYSIDNRGARTRPGRI